MAEQSAIEWCDSTFNPWIGCTRVSPACDDCYAARSTPARTLGIQWGSHAERHRTAPATWTQPKTWERQHEAFFAQHGRRRRVFCASLADVFDNAVPVEWRVDLFKLIAATPHLDWLLLTKRVGNAAGMLNDVMLDLSCGSFEWTAEAALPNVWIGVTVVTQAEVDRDVPRLLALPARVRFLSIEPMLGPISFEGMFATDNAIDGTNALEALDWVICGGESGPRARPMHPDWARGLRDQCAAAGVPFLFKQWGEWVPRGPQCWSYPVVDNVPRFRMTDQGQSGQDLAAEGGNHVWMNRAGKKVAGRLLDGRTHDAFPEVRHAHS